MKVSELIAELQKAMDEHGDLPVYYFDNEFGCEPPTQVRHEPKPCGMYQASAEPGIVIE